MFGFTTCDSGRENPENPREIHVSFYLFSGNHRLPDVNRKPRTHLQMVSSSHIRLRQVEISEEIEKQKKT